VTIATRPDKSGSCSVLKRRLRRVAGFRVSGRIEDIVVVYYSIA
jgi:hypothetical protein